MGASYVSRSVRRYEVGINEITPIKLAGNPIAVGTAVPGAGLEFWAEYDDTRLEVTHSFTIVATGQEIPKGAQYVGTAPMTPNGVVWHLYELSFLTKV